MTISSRLPASALVGSRLVPSILAGGAWDGDEAVSPPVGWMWTLPFNIVRHDSTFAPTNFDVSRYAPAGKAYYVATNGNDLADGLTPATPLRKILTALGKADVDVVYVAAGDYHRDYQWNVSPARNVAVIATGGVVRSTVHQTGLSWVQDGTYTNTYKATRSNTIQLRDVLYSDSNGDSQKLTQLASADLVDAAPGSWCIDGSNVVYVRLSDDRVPDADLRIYLAGINNGLVTGNVHVYAEGIVFEGGGSPFRAATSGAGQDQRIYFKNCQFKYGTDNGLTVLGSALVIAQGCVSAKNWQDGFNYHVQNAVIPNAIEINCVGRDNGAVNGTANDNGSSIHDGGNIVRLNGEYYRNVGPNVIDIGPSLSWNLGTYAHDSASDVVGLDNNFSITGTMWCDRCRSTGSTYDYVAAAASTLYKRLCIGDASDNGAGTVGAY